MAPSPDPTLRIAGRSTLPLERCGHASLHLPSPCPLTLQPVVASGFSGFSTLSQASLVRDSGSGRPLVNLNLGLGLIAYGLGRSIIPSPSLKPQPCPRPCPFRRQDLEPFLSPFASWPCPSVGLACCTCLKHQQVQRVVLQVGGGGDLVSGDTQDELLIVSPGEKQAAG